MYEEELKKIKSQLKEMEKNLHSESSETSNSEAERKIDNSDSGSIVDLEIDFFTKSVKGSVFLTFLDSLKNENSFLSEIFNWNKDMKIEPEESYNIVTEIGLNFNNDSMKKIFQLIKMIKFFNHIKEYCEILKGKLTDRNKNLFNEFNLKQKNIYLLLTNGDPKKYPRNLEEINNTPEKFSQKMILHVNCFNKIVDNELVYLIYVPFPTSKIFINISQHQCR